MTNTTHFGPNRPEWIIVHCSASAWGDRAIIDEWHRARGFDRCGYHAVILNGHVRSHDAYDRALDGVVQEGRAHEDTGAHCVGYNSRSLGVCLIGVDDYSSQQMLSLMAWLRSCCERYDIDPESVLGHRETVSGARQGKSCPTGLDMGAIRAGLVALIAGDGEDDDE